MSTEEVQDQVVEEVAPVVDEPLTLQTALKTVLKNSLYADGLSRGLRESVKALDRREAHLCVLSNSCDAKSYSGLIVALCEEHNIPRVNIEDSTTLGEWVGLCKISPEGQAVNIINCSCAVIRAWGEETPAIEFIQNYIKNQK